MNAEKSRNDHDRFPWTLFIIGTTLAIVLPLAVASISSINLTGKTSIFSLSTFIVAFVVALIGLRKKQ